MCRVFVPPCQDEIPKGYLGTIGEAKDYVEIEFLRDFPDAKINYVAQVGATSGFMCIAVNYEEFQAEFTKYYHFWILEKIT